MTARLRPLGARTWPLVELRDGVPHWHIAGTNPPEYERNEQLEALYMEAQQQKAPRKVVQLELWEKAA